MRVKIIVFILTILTFQNIISQEDTIGIQFLQSEYFRNKIEEKLIYPENARLSGIEGIVVVKFKLTKTGCIDSITVLESPDVSLSNSTISALNQVKCGWKPTEKGNVPVDCWWKFLTQFTLPLNESKGQFNSLERALINPQKVIYLSLKNKNLTDLPQQLFLFKNLFALELEHNMILKLPKDIQSLKKLNFLLLGKNQIKFLPPEITNLKKLYKIGLSDNKLDSVPKEIFYLESLWELDLANNNIVSIPSEIKNLKKLKYLYLSNNKLSKLPEELLKIDNLKEINLRGNSFTDSEKEYIRKRLTKTKIIF